MIRIYADSTNDLGKELIEKHNIRIVPLYVRMGEKTVKDGPGLNPDTLYEWADKNKTTPSTAAFSPGDAEAAIKEAKKAGDDILFFGISSEMSASCSVFKVAAEDVDYSDHVFVVDSRNLSTGIGLTILKAAAMVEEGGMTMDNAAQIIVYLRDGTDYETVRRMFQEKYPDIPTVFTLAPVCRPTWLIEMECMAIQPAANDNFSNF